MEADIDSDLMQHLLAISARVSEVEAAKLAAVGFVQAQLFASEQRASQAEARVRALETSRASASVPEEAATTRSCIKKLKKRLRKLNEQLESNEAAYLERLEEFQALEVEHESSIDEALVETRGAHDSLLLQLGDQAAEVESMEQARNDLASALAASELRLEDAVASSQRAAEGKLKAAEENFQAQNSTAAARIAVLEGELENSHAQARNAATEARTELKRLQRQIAARTKELEDQLAESTGAAAARTKELEGQLKMAKAEAENTAAAAAANNEKVQLRAHAAEAEAARKASEEKYAGLAESNATAAARTKELEDMLAKNDKAAATRIKELEGQLKIAEQVAVDNEELKSQVLAVKAAAEAARKASEEKYASLFAEGNVAVAEAAEAEAEAAAAAAAAARIKELEDQLAKSNSIAAVRIAVLDGEPKKVQTKAAAATTTAADNVKLRWPMQAAEEGAGAPEASATSAEGNATAAAPITDFVGELDASNLQAENPTTVAAGAENGKNNLQAPKAEVEEQAATIGTIGALISDLFYSLVRILSCTIS